MAELSRPPPPPPPRTAAEAALRAAGRQEVLRGLAETRLGQLTALEDALAGRSRWADVKLTRADVDKAAAPAAVAQLVAVGCGVAKVLDDDGGAEAAPALEVLARLGRLFAELDYSAGSLPSKAKTLLLANAAPSPWPRSPAVVVGPGGGVEDGDWPALPRPVLSRCGQEVVFEHLSPVAGASGASFARAACVCLKIARMAYARLCADGTDAAPGLGAPAGGGGDAAWARVRRVDEKLVAYCVEPAVAALRDAALAVARRDLVTMREGFG